MTSLISILVLMATCLVLSVFASQGRPNHPRERPRPFPGVSSPHTVPQHFYRHRAYRPLVREAKQTRVPLLALPSSESSAEKEKSGSHDTNFDIQ